MKKKLFIGLVAVFFSAMFVSCNKKDITKRRTCECTVSVTVMGYTSSQTVSDEYDGSCSELENAASGEIAQAVKELEAVGGSVTVKCHEK
jgi:hypothetical protein